MPLWKVGTHDRDDHLKLERWQWEKDHFLTKSYHVTSVVIFDDYRGFRAGASVHKLFVGSVRLGRKWRTRVWSRLFYVHNVIARFLLCLSKVLAKDVTYDVSLRA